MIQSQFFTTTINTFTIRNKPISAIIANHTGLCNKNRLNKINCVVDLFESDFWRKKVETKVRFTKTHSINKTDIALPEQRSETKFAGRETQNKSKKAAVFLELQNAKTEFLRSKVERVLWAFFVER